MKTIITSLVLVLIVFSSCDKEPESIGPESAVIHDYGDPAVDGCGWVIETSNNEYKAINLPENFKVDNLEVQIEYVILESWASCGLLADAYSEIDIINIY